MSQLKNKVWFLFLTLHFNFIKLFKILILSSYFIFNDKITLNPYLSISFKFKPILGANNQVIDTKENIMGIDYDGVGGIGIELTNNMIQTVIKKGIFTQEMWKENQDHCLDILGFTYANAGSYYSGDIKTYLFVNGNNLGEINKNAPGFIEKLKQFDIIYSVDDIELIKDVCIS